MVAYLAEELEIGDAEDAIADMKNQLAWARDLSPEDGDLLFNGSSPFRRTSLPSEPLISLSPRCKGVSSACARGTRSGGPQAVCSDRARVARARRRIARPFA